MKEFCLSLSGVLCTLLQQRQSRDGEVNGLSQVLWAAAALMADCTLGTFKGKLQTN